MSFNGVMINVIELFLVAYFVFRGTFVFSRRGFFFFIVGGVVYFERSFFYWGWTCMYE